MPDEPTRSLYPDPKPTPQAAGSSAREAVTPHPKRVDPPLPPVGGPHPAAQGETLEHIGRKTGAPESLAPTLDASHASATTILLLQRHFGDYELLEEVARGGMGVVFKVRQKSLDRIVALKMILAGHLASREQVRRFRLEAEEAGHLDHSNIVPIYQVGEHAGQHYFTMKLIEGGNLAQRLKGKPMPPRDAVRLVAKIARAVYYAHQRGILHRDLKPGNILLDAAGEPHVTDFGLAKHLVGPGGQQAANAPTQSGAVVGTPAYMAPEQAAARKDLSVAVDVYSLGAILFELLTGRPPFQAETPIDTILKVMEEDPPRPRSLNPKLDRDLEIITLKCLEKEPTHRYGSALRLAEDLERYLSSEPIQARPATVVERTVKWARRRPAAAALLGVICLAGVLFLAFGWWTNLRLKTALDQTELERGEAARQRDQFKASLQKRLDIIDDFLVRMDDRLQRQGVPGSVRMEFLHDALELSKGVLKEDPNNVNARKQLGNLYYRIGDLYRLSRIFPEGDDHFTSALDVQEKLVKDFPKRPDYRHDLAITSARYARLLQEQRRFDEALKSVDRAIQLEDELTVQDSEDARYPEYAAYYRYRRADLLEASGKTQEAEKGYREALEQQEQLVAHYPDKIVHHVDLASTATSLAMLLGTTNPQAAIPYWERVVKANRDLLGLTRNDKQQAWRLSESYYDVAAVLRQCGKHAELFHLGEQLRQDLPDDSASTYNAACFAANAAQAARESKALSESEHERIAGAYAEQAVKLVDKAIHEGYRDHAHMAGDSDLDPLRSRKDYQELVAALERRYPTPPRSPSEDLSAMLQQHKNAQDNYEQLRHRAETVAEKKKAESKKPQFEGFVERCLQFAQKHRDSTAAVDSLVWVLENTAPSADKPISPPTAALREKALKLLEQDHFQKPELGSVCQRLSESPAPDCEQLLRAAAANHKHHDVQGLAGYALAMSLARQAEASLQTGSPGTPELFRSAEEQMEKVLKEYADVPCGRTNLGEVARAKLSALRHLAIGRPAQDIEGHDLDGKPMKLSDLRGKVVVLAFWADWCGYSRQMYAQERALVERLKDKPFALVGVNCDDDKEQAKRVIQKGRLNWRNWFNGDQAGRERITQAWQVDHFPTIYVLDAKGLIRFKEVRGEQLESAVEQLLKEQ
jgi:tetratricopeptide (TPR) repeat protein